MIVKGNVLIAEEKRAIRVKGSLESSCITRVSLSSTDSKDNWEDCDYGSDELTMADKDAALRRFGVEV